MRRISSSCLCLLFLWGCSSSSNAPSPEARRAYTDAYMKQNTMIFVMSADSNDIAWDRAQEYINRTSKVVGLTDSTMASAPPWTDEKPGALITRTFDDSVTRYLVMYDGAKGGDRSMPLLKRFDSARKELGFFMRTGLTVEDFE